MRHGVWVGLLGLCALGLTAQGHCAVLGGRISFVVHAGKRVGMLRQLQGVDNGPLCERGAVDLGRYFRKLRVPYVRLHDVPWSYGDALDINYIFPKWRAPAEEAGSYDFRLSDFYLKSVVELHAKIIYRLGYSAEFKRPVLHNSPPKSFRKFATIAAHVVEHYDNGWAHGQRWGIRYWEIWNEPDNANFWTGTPRQYDRLYAVVARRLKSLDPGLEVGGPALAAHLGFLRQFLRYCRMHRVPVDFVSWHMYARDPRAVVSRARQVRKLMDQYGFTRAKSVLDEWNYGPKNWSVLFHDAAASQAYFRSIQESVGAAYDAAVLIDLQDAPVNVATFYAGTTELWGMFAPWGTPYKPYYAFLAFSKLLRTRNRVAVTGLGHGAEGMAVLAGATANRDMVRVLLSNYADAPKVVTLAFADLPKAHSWHCKVQVLDAEQNLGTVVRKSLSRQAKLDIELKPHSVVLVTMSAKR